ncbi:betaine/carnitine transporter, BCCT family [Ferrimonas sediminum]|uniref:Betaine/carnitine transporter, BCCT family n=1 Tax=Ferrimonas sediminum TaxID=718193 RepID=A0A1G8PRP8_9GAMM|nr:BCCT family transporter [Ferrimonas sediminum]SDI95143.1 betaine/carnitine transporter, BCCT family [Ferrimonas sediminum]
MSTIPSTEARLGFGASSLLPNIDTFKFFGAFILVLLGTLPMLLYPDSSKTLIFSLFQFITQELGWLYIMAGIGAFLWCLWLAFGPHGNKVLGSTPEYSDYSWVAMLVCAGVGSGIMYGSMLDWAHLSNLGINGTEVGSAQAKEWASAYAMFHWGPIAWAMYATLAIPIAYSFHVKKTPVLNISQCCHFLLGDRVNGATGKVIDILFMIGLIGGAATSLSLGAPVIAAGISALTGVPNGLQLEVLVLFLVTAVFGMSAFFGIKRGLRAMSDINVVLSVALLAFVLLTGPTVFTMEMGVSTLGRVLSNFVAMATNMDPIENCGLISNWTVFYWAWWASFAPFMSIFIAKISRGRTVKATILVTLVAASSGCAAFYIIFGNFGLQLQLSGQLDVATLVTQFKGGEVIVRMAEYLPLTPLFIGTFSLVCGIFLATTYDAVSYALSATTTAHLTPDQEPARWNRLFWAFVLSLLPLGIMVVNGPLEVLQTATIVSGLPIMGVVTLGIVSFVKEVKATGWAQSR